MSLSQILGQIKTHEINGLNLGLTQHKTRLIGRIEKYSMSALETKTLLNQNGSGVINAIWLAIQQGNMLRDSVLRVYVDGEATPSIQFDLGTMGLGFTTTAGTSWTNHVWLGRSAGGTSAGAFMLRFPIPYSVSIKIDLYNPTAQSGFIWTQVFDMPNLILPLRLKSVNVSYLNKTTILNTDNIIYQFFNLTGIEGWLIWHSFMLDGVSNSSCLESDVNIYVDGEETPSISSTGTEDWFTDSFYFNGTAASVPWRLLSVVDWTNYKFTVGIDLMEFLGGIYFTKGVKAEFDTTESAMTTDFDMAYTWLYYQKV